MVSRNISGGVLGSFRISKTNSWFFEKINKISNPLANLTKMKREKIQINKTRNENREISSNTM
jgi:hypothetical protein